MTASDLDFHVAIPSRGRVHEFYLQTYRKLIYRYSLEAVTTVFVQTPEDLAAYTEAFPRVQVVLSPGVGLAAAQEAIRLHYPLGARVVVMHDDVTRVVRMRDGRIRRFDDVRRLFRVTFEVMERYGVTLGGLASNPSAICELATVQKVTLALRFIYDPLHFEITHDAPVQTRLTAFAASTRHRPTGNHRELDVQDCTLLKREYPEEIAKVRTHRGGYSSLVLRSLPYCGPLAAERGSAACEREAELLFYEKLGNFDVTPDLETPGGRLLELLENFAWNVNELRTAVVPPERRNIYVSKRNKLESLRVDMPLYSYSLHEGDIFAACQAVLPAGLCFDFVTVNKNICCYPHRDAGNAGPSLILFLGKFEGGALCTEAGERFAETGIFHAFDGTKLHWNEPLTGGTKYSIVYYNRATVSLKNSEKVANPREAQDLSLAKGVRVRFDLYALH